MSDVSYGKKKGRLRTRKVLNEEEIKALRGDLIKIHRALREGLSVGIGELDSVINSLHRKLEQCADYSQIVID